MTSIFFKEETNNGCYLTIPQNKIEDLSTSLECLKSVTDATMYILEKTNLDSSQNAQFKLTTVYHLNYLLNDYCSVLHERVNKIAELKTK